MLKNPLCLIMLSSQRCYAFHKLNYLCSTHSSEYIFKFKLLQITLKVQISGFRSATALNPGPIKGPAIRV